ncbi:MAG: hypothetical protein ACRDZO_18625 [Egibacteraceae bacterium]
MRPRRARSGGMTLDRSCPPPQPIPYLTSAIASLPDRQGTSRAPARTARPTRGSRHRQQRVDGQQRHRGQPRQRTTLGELRCGVAQKRDVERLHPDEAKTRLIASSMWAVRALAAGAVGRRSNRARYDASGLTSPVRGEVDLSELCAALLEAVHGTASPRLRPAGVRP